VTKPKELKTIDTVVAKDLGGGYIKITAVVGTKLHELRVKRSVAVGIIGQLAQALDGNLHTM